MTSYYGEVKYVLWHRVTSRHVAPRFAARDEAQAYLEHKTRPGSGKINGTRIVEDPRKPDATWNGKKLKFLKTDQYCSPRPYEFFS
jgi:hypothetical protein